MLITSIKQNDIPTVKSKLGGAKEKLKRVTTDIFKQKHVEESQKQIKHLKTLLTEDLIDPKIRKGLDPDRLNEEVEDFISIAPGRQFNLRNDQMMPKQMIKMQTDIKELDTLEDEWIL